jgi:digeranylgeranylglycerophospholipid reductase
MERIDCDVLVIGAGPAGAIAAKYAAEQGANVLIVDKKSEIGLPVRCGEGLPMHVLEDYGFKGKGAWVANVAKFMKLVSPKGKEVVVEPHIPPAILNRDVFEKELVRRAEKKGAKLMLRTMALEATTGKGRIKSVTLKPDDGGKDGLQSVRPKVVIAADGVESRVGRWIGIRTRSALKDTATCAQYVVEHESIDKDTLEFWLGGDYARIGYAWVFPKGKWTANVGIGMLPEKDLGPVEVTDNFIKLRADGAKKSNFTVGCIPLGLPVEESVKGNVMLAGDAARMVNGLTGAGVANALISGQIAGKVAGKVATGKKELEHLKEYDPKWRKIIERKLKKSFKYRKKIERGDKYIERFFRLIRFGMFFYKLSPKYIGSRMMTDFYYTSSEVDD